MIKEERRAGNPVAGLIHSLQLEANKATLLLSNMLDDEDEGDEEANTRAATKVGLGVEGHGRVAQRMCKLACHQHHTRPAAWWELGKQLATAVHHTSAVHSTSPNVPGAPYDRALWPPACAFLRCKWTWGCRRMPTPQRTSM